MNFVKLIEESAVNLVKTIKFPTVQVAKQDIRRYRGEADGLYGLLQTDFNPRAPYILIEYTNGRYTFAGSSPTDLACDGMLKMYVGHQGPDYQTTRDTIGEIVFSLESELNNVRVLNGTNPVCDLYLDSDTQAFVMKNHIIWTIDFRTKTLLRSLGKIR